MKKLLHLAIEIEGQLAWEKMHFKRNVSSKSTSFPTTTWLKNSNSGKLDFKPKEKIEFEKKDKDESSREKKNWMDRRRFEKRVET